MVQERARPEREIWTVPAGSPPAVALVRLDDLTVEAATETTRSLLDLPVHRIVGRRVTELLDAEDRDVAASALRVLRAGPVDFFRVHGRATASLGGGRGFVAWVRAVQFDTTPYALVTWLDERRAAWSRHNPEDMWGRFAALAITTSDGAVTAAFADPTVAPGLTAEDLLGSRLISPSQLESLITVPDGAVQTSRGMAIGFPVSVTTREGRVLEFHGVVATLLGSSNHLMGLLIPLAPGPREAELESHLWRIAAEIEASGILLRAGENPDLSLVQIPAAASLTPRQWEVLRRLLAGQRVPTIARELYVSQSTVRNHLSAIFDRFGVHSQPELLDRLARRDGPLRSTDGPSIA